MAEQGMYKINKRPKDEQIESLVIGDYLSKMREEIEKKFGILTENMEYQLAELRRQIANEKETQAQLQQQLADKKKQSEEFKQESINQTSDLRSMNSFYSNKQGQDAYDNLLSQVIARHQQMQQALQQANYNGDVVGMNQAWQNEIKGIKGLLSSLPDAGEFATIKDELAKRTQDLDTIKQISEGKLPVSTMENLVDNCEERHAGMAGDEASGYKPAGKIQSEAVLQDNERWAALMNNMKDFMEANTKRLRDRNDLFFIELQGRVQDLNQFKDILSNTHIPQENDPKFKRKKKELNALKNQAVQQRNDQLMQSVQTRQTQNEANVRATAAGGTAKDQQAVEAFAANDAQWTNELGQDTRAVIEYTY